MPLFSSIILIAVPVSILALIYASQRHEPEPPLLPTNRRPHSGYTEPRSSHSPVETPSPAPRSVSPSTPAPRSGFVAGEKAFTARSDLNVLPTPTLPPPPPPPPPPLPHSSVRGPQQYSFSRDNFPGTSTEQVYRPTTKASVQNAVEPGLDSINQAPPPESLFGARKPHQYSFSGKDLPGRLIEPIDQPTTKVYIPKTAEPALDSVYQPLSSEPLFGTRKPQQYSFSKNDLPRTSIEPIHRPAIVAPVQKALLPDPPFGVREPRQYSYSRDGLPRNSIDQVYVPATKAFDSDQKAVDSYLDPVNQSPLLEPSFGTRKPQQYSYSRDDLPRNSVDQVYRPAAKALDQKVVDLSLDPEPSFGTRRPQQYSYSRNDLPSPLVENVNRPAAKVPTRDTGEPSIINPFSFFLDLKNKGTVVDGGRDDGDDDIKDLDHLALRKLADQEKENMKKCRTEEKLARRYHLPIQARDLKAQAMRHKKRMQELNDRASEVVFAKNNKDPALRRIDLHGLKVNEAIGHTKRVLEQARERGNSEMRIIVGKGKHSRDGLPKLKPAIQTFLKENKFLVEIDPRNNGVFLVKLDSAPSS